MQESQQGWQRWFAPRQDTQMVAAQQTKGLFLPYPLLGILTTVGALVLSGIVGLYVQVSSLQTTILLRDSDTRRDIMQLKEDNEELRVYIQNDREQLVALREWQKNQDSKRR